MLKRQSYVHLKPFEVESGDLAKLYAGATVELSREAFSTVVEMLGVLDPGFVVYDGSAAAGGRRTSLARNRPRPAVARPLPPSPPSIPVRLPLPPPPPPQRAPQRAPQPTYTRPPQPPPPTTRATTYNYPPMQQQPPRASAGFNRDLEATSTTPLLHSYGNYNYHRRRRQQACADLARVVLVLLGVIALGFLVGWYLGAAFFGLEGWGSVLWASDSV